MLHPFPIAVSSAKKWAAAENPQQRSRQTDTPPFDNGAILLGHPPIFNPKAHPWRGLPIPFFRAVVSLANRPSAHARRPRKKISRTLNCNFPSFLCFSFLLMKQLWCFPLPPSQLRPVDSCVNLVTQKSSNRCSDKIVWLLLVLGGKTQIKLLAQ